MTTTRWLEPIAGLQRLDPQHRYWLDDHLFPVSITGVLQVAKSSYALGRIEASRAVWEPRGNTCHQALEINAYHFAAAAGMGQAQLQLGDQSSALESFRRALRLNPDLEAVRVQITRLSRRIEGR